MIKVKVAGGLAGVALLCMGALAPGEVALAQEPTKSQEVLRLLETAQLSPDGKLLIRQKAGEAMRAGVAERDVANVIRLAVDHGVRAADLGSLLDVVSQAKRRDVPVGPVLDKVQEGLAKRAPPDRIASVASHISENLLAAREVVRRAEHDGVRVERESERDKTVEAVAEALGRGVTTSQVEELARRVARSGQRDTTHARFHSAAQGTADLVAMGLTPRDASETVAAAVTKGFSQQEVQKLRERLARELRRGRSPEEGARYLREEIQSGPPAKADKPEKPAKPEKPDKPEKPEKPEKPGR